VKLDYGVGVQATGLVMLSFVLGCTAGDDLPAPMISSITPDHASPGVSVTIEGDYLCQQQETGEEDPLACAITGTVAFGQTPGTVGLYTEHEIAVEVPGLEPTSYPVSVSVGGRRSNALTFVVDAPYHSPTSEHHRSLESH
jgi:hypothetical protein